MTWRFEMHTPTTTLIYPGRTWEQAMRLWRLFTNTTGQGNIYLYAEKEDT